MQSGVSSYALTDAGVVSASAAYTSKRALTKDPRHLGFGGEDDMALSRILGHRSLLTIVAWPTSAARETVLVSIPVDPLVVTVNTGPPFRAFATSLAYGSLPFKFWRGSIKFTIRVVCSNFHTGILRAVYDPGLARGGSLDTTWPVGMSENCIITATPGGSTTIQVCYTSQSRWLPVGADFNALGAATYPNSIGRLALTVENALQAPLAGSGATILVYVEAGPDFQVFGCKESIPRYSIKATSTGGNFPSIADGGGVGVEAAPQSALVGNDHTGGVCVFGGAPSPAVDISEAIMGERISSLRAILKRFIPVGYLQASADANSTVLTTKGCGFTSTLVPPLLSTTPGPGVTMTYLDHNTLWRYFRLGFVGHRGGVRYRLSDFCLYRDNGVPGLSAFPARYMIYPGNSCAPDTTAAVVSSNRALFPQMAGAGGALFDLNRNEMPDVEVPDYNRGSFHYAGDTGGVASSVSEGVVFFVSKACTDFTKCITFVSMAAADDFSFIHWQGVPKVYLVS